MAITYKQKCQRCRKNYVEKTRRQNFILCFDCQKSEMEGEIKDPKIKKLLDIPDEYYQRNSFLRNIKIAYLKYESLSEKQIEAFKKTVDKLNEESKTESN